MDYHTGNGTGAGNGRWIYNSICKTGLQFYIYDVCNDQIHQYYIIHRYTGRFFPDTGLPGVYYKPSGGG